MFKAERVNSDKMKDKDSSSTYWIRTEKNHSSPLKTGEKSKFELELFTFSLMFASVNRGKPMD